MTIRMEDPTKNEQEPRKIPKRDGNGIGYIKKQELLTIGSINIKQRRSREREFNRIFY